VKAGEDYSDGITSFREIQVCLLILVTIAKIALDLSLKRILELKPISRPPTKATRR
jgi:hypothetical protein